MDVVTTDLISRADDKKVRCKLTDSLTDWKFADAVPAGSKRKQAG
jgi:hypothetical protein